MKRGYLSQYFTEVAVKRLSKVETNPEKSNQHEFNGTKPLKKLFGPERLNDFPARFVWLGGDNDGISEEGRITWYDARERHPKRSEYRLYFRKNSVMELAGEGDLLIVAKRPDNSIYIFVVKANSTIENQLLWLFGVQEQVGFKFSVELIENEKDLEINFAVRYILEEIGLSVDEYDADFLDALLSQYHGRDFPTTAEFSAFARKTVPEKVSPLEDPDGALIHWMEHEEKLFRRLERNVVAQRIKQGFSTNGSVDVDGFIEFSLSILNRRKSRAGKALENHLEEIFKIHKVSYSRNKITENKAKPDFLFPGISQYRNPDFPASRLTMLGVKSTCKDRWRQVLTEAARIDVKHLFTLEPGISENQTAEMQAHRLQLVLPKSLHETYKPKQKKWLLDLKSFIKLVKSRQ